MDKNELNKNGLRKASAVALLAVAAIPYVAATVSVVKALKGTDKKEK